VNIQNCIQLFPSYSSRPLALSDTHLLPILALHHLHLRRLRVHAGMLNALLLMRLVTSPAFVTHKDVTFNGTSVIDPTRRYYYGNSQGGIFGSVYMALTTDVERGVLGVGGGPYNLLLPRSKDFEPLFVRSRTARPKALMTHGAYVMSPRRNHARFIQAWASSTFGHIGGRGWGGGGGGGRRHKSLHLRCRRDWDDECVGCAEGALFCADTNLPDESDPTAVESDGARRYSLISDKDPPIGYRCR